MDGRFMCLSAHSNDELVNRIGVAAGLGKTEVMPSFCGQGSRSMRRRFSSLSEGAHFPVVCEAGISMISVVSRYTHLGGVLHHRDVTKGEISRRLSIARSAFAQHRKLLYKNTQLAWDKRVELFQTLVLSKLTYGLESWTFSCQRSRNHFHAGVMRLYRKLCQDAHESDEAILQRTGLPLPASSGLKCHGCHQ